MSKGYVGVMGDDVWTLSRDELELEWKRMSCGVVFGDELGEAALLLCEDMEALRDVGDEEFDFRFFPLVCGGCGYSGWQERG